MKYFPFSISSRIVTVSRPSLITSQLVTYIFIPILSDKYQNLSIRYHVVTFDGVAFISEDDDTRIDAITVVGVQDLDFVGEESKIYQRM